MRDSPERLRPYNNDGSQVVSKTAGGASSEIRGADCMAAYVPPHKRARLALAGLDEDAALVRQRTSWEVLRKGLNGVVNKVNAANLAELFPELLAHNVVRGRGLLSRALLRAQLASPAFAPTFAAFASVVNTKFPEFGELLLQRLVLQFRRSYRRNEKRTCIALVGFIAHLINHRVAHEILALQMLMLLLENPTDDSVEIAAVFSTECGACLLELSPQGLHSIFDRLRCILHEGNIDRRVQYFVERLFAARKKAFADNPAVPAELDLVDPDDQVTHDIGLDDDLDSAAHLDTFQPDPEFEANEAKYEIIRNMLLGGGVGGSSDELALRMDTPLAPPTQGDEKHWEGRMPDSATGGRLDSAVGKGKSVHDMTETNLTNLRRTIYLTIMSSVDFEEAGHKLMKIRLLPGEEIELCTMLIECCSQERTYMRYYGLLGQRLCEIDRNFRLFFDDLFARQYGMIHRLETNKLRNVAKFFAHLLCTEALQWSVLAYVRLTEAETSSSSRIFIKILFQEVAEHIGLLAFRDRLAVPEVARHCSGLFPRDTAPNMRFAINFYTSIGLGGLTDELREHLRNLPALVAQQKAVQAARTLDRAPSSSSRSTCSSTFVSSESYDTGDTSSRSSHSRRGDSTSSSSDASGESCSPVR